MSTFVLVHGAFGGSYGFRHVRRLLTAAGHEVLTPSLTGIGERSHLASADIDLNLHVRDVANAVSYEDVRDIVLLGFSYGGMVVTGAIDHIGDRVRELVYLDAFVPGDGETVVDQLGPPGAAMVASAVDGFVAPIGRDLGDEAANEWMGERRVSQPVRTFTTPVSLSKPLETQGFGLTFIKATEDPPEPPDSPFWNAYHHAVESDAWRAHRVDCNHMVPELRPDDLTRILTDL